ncbi:MAG: methyltransferase domain-containing protein [Ginsengibacter sp.]
MRKLSFNTILFLVVFLSIECNTSKKNKDKGEEKTEYTFSKASKDGTGKFYLGREISQVMGSDGGAWLERDERQQEENVKLSIDKMNLSPGSSVADIGAGTGYYSFRIAEKVPQGKVYAVEIQDDFIKYLNNKKKELKIKNVEVIKGSDHSPNLPENSIDLVMMADVYHELEYPYEMLQSIKKSLKQNGKLLLLEYRGEDAALAIKPLHKTTILQLNKELAANGFKLVYDGEFLPIQHFLLYQKN